MKKTIAHIFLKLAVLGMLMHLFIPHHHHDVAVSCQCPDEIFTVEKEHVHDCNCSHEDNFIFSVNHEESCKAHQHDKDHEHCLFSSYWIPEKGNLAICSKSHSLLNEVQFRTDKIEFTVRNEEVPIFYYRSKVLLRGPPAC